MSSDRNMSRLSETHSEVSAISYPKASFIHSSKAMLPPKSAPVLIQKSYHVAATPSLQWQIEKDLANREEG